MHCLMIACHPKSLLSRLGLIVTEPLALETLAAVLDGVEGTTYRIYDPLLEGGRPEHVIRRERPDILLLTGYLTASGEILRLARVAKSRNPRTLVWVGGVQAEAAPETFFDEAVDAVFTGGALGTLRQLLSEHRGDLAQGYRETSGLAYRSGGEWLRTADRRTRPDEIPIPNRGYFEQHREKTRYMGRRDVALVKTTVGCPAACTFCGCRVQNGGHYIERSMDAVEQELSGLRSGDVWVVDDNFLVSRRRVTAWIDMLEGLARSGRRFRFIAYGRADRLLDLEDLLPRLRAVGFVEWIVGFESIDDQRLETLAKGTSAHANDAVIDLLKRHGLTLTALFMVSPPDDASVFRRLEDWLVAKGVHRFTVSIATPLPGTDAYRPVSARALRRYDFLHLVDRPRRMSRLYFYLLFWKLSLKARPWRG